MTSYIQHPDGGIQEISEGWILRHTKTIDKVTVIKSIDSTSACTCLFKLADGRVCSMEWGVEAECRVWLKRPSLRGRELVWFGERMRC